MSSGRDEPCVPSSGRRQRTQRNLGASPGLFLALALAACTAEEPAGSSLAAADALIAARRFRAALAEVDSYLTEHANDRDALDRKILILRLLGDERQALALLLELRAVAPTDARLAYEAGELHAHLGEKKLAHDEFAEARALDSSDWRPAVAEAALLLSEKPPQTDAALERLAPWLEGPTARAEARFHRGLALEAKEDRAAAFAEFERALELDPRHVPSLCNAARLAEAAGDRARALARLKTARAAAPDDDPSFLRTLDAEIQRLEAQGRSLK